MSRSFHDILAPTVPLSRHIFKAPTRFYKTGVVFMAYLNGLQDHFTMVGGQESARSTLHLAELFRLADCRRSAVRSRARGEPHETRHGDARGALMRDLSRDRSLLAINSATVKSWTLEQLVEGCVRAGITAIAPWRDIVQAAGVEKAGNLIRGGGIDRDLPVPRRACFPPPTRRAAVRRSTTIAALWTRPPRSAPARSC